VAAALSLAIMIFPSMSITTMAWVEWLARAFWLAFALGILFQSIIPFLPYSCMLSAGYRGHEGGFSIDMPIKPNNFGGFHMGFPWVDVGWPQR
jgi:hypothetical protein